MRHCRLTDASNGLHSRRGQSLLELALFLPVLLLLIAGMVEIGVYANTFMLFLDASREGARFGANLDPELTVDQYFDNRGGNPFPDVTAMTAEQILEVCRNGETVNFYYEVACLVLQNIPAGQLDPTPKAGGWPGDDVVISVVRVKTGGQVDERWPTVGQRDSQDPAYHFVGADKDDLCWSLYGIRGSELTQAEIEAQLVAGAPKTGYVIVEVYHAHDHFTGFFTVGDFIPDPVPSRAYSVFPVAAAEPD